MITKEEAKEKIKGRIDFYKSHKEKLSKISERDTRVKFIDRVLEALGWDVFGEKGNDVLREETITGQESKKKKADYTLRINEIPKLIVEAKAIKEDLEKEDYIKQAVGYAFNKACSWAVLTDFEGVKIFFVNRDNEMSPFFDIKLTNLEKFDDNFEILWFISRESVLNEELEKEAKRRGIKKEKVNVDIQLYKDLKEWRDSLFKEIKNRYREKYKEDEIDEIVQRIIDRLIFIRKAEDSELEERRLDQLIRRFSDTTNFYNELKKIFNEYNQKYDSNLFLKHECDKIEIENWVIEKVIKEMYRPKGRKVEYNFTVIDADVLGNIYEQYLAYTTYRKEQGIYYTPTYIVNYIVKNTVREYIKNKDTNEILQTKILDPACGSGSFLIKAFQEVCNAIEELLKKGKRSKKWRSFNAYGGRLNLAQKIIIMENCIHGVDLDPKAVEIAQLNLLFKLLEGEKHKSGKMLLPILKNIKCGNSLIDDKTIEPKHSFKWEVEFPFKFDIVIGNPPYGAELRKEERDYLKNKFKMNNTDTAILFMSLSKNILCKGGVNSFIIPKSFVYALTWEKIREELLEGITEIVDCGKVWKEVKLEQVIYFFKKNVKEINYTSCILKNQNILCIGKINKQTFYDFGFLLNGISSSELKIGKKIRKKGGSLNKFIYNQRGLTCQSKITNKPSDFKVIGGKQIQRYFIRKETKGFISEKFITNEKAFIKKESILVQSIVAHIKKPKDHIKIMATIFKDLQTSRYIIVDTINQLNNKGRLESNFILGLINSKLINWYAYRFIFGKAIRTMRFDNPATEKIILPNLNLKNKEDNRTYHKIIGLVNQMFEFQKKDCDEKMQGNEKERLKKEIQKLDEEIDQEVYKLYRITKEEEEIIEESLK